MINSKQSLYEWLAEIEQFSGVSERIGDRATCETGDRYVEIFWNYDGTVNSVDHGHLPGCLYVALPQTAWALSAAAFFLYWVSRQGKIHWRVRPELLRKEPPEGMEIDLGDRSDEAILEAISNLPTYIVYMRAFIEQAEHLQPIPQDLNPSCR